jgi:ABC-type multidrug transport system fused ATPase/permease subunit
MHSPQVSLVAVDAQIFGKTGVHACGASNICASMDVQRGSELSITGRIDCNTHVTDIHELFMYQHYCIAALAIAACFAALVSAAGRLINRFTKDTEALDIQMAAAVNSALTCLVGALLSIVVVVVVSPYTILALIPLGLLYYRWAFVVRV